MLRWAADPQDKSVMVGAEEGVSVDSCRPPPPMGSGDSRKIRVVQDAPGSNSQIQASSPGHGLLSTLYSSPLGSLSSCRSESRGKAERACPQGQEEGLFGKGHGSKVPLV